METGSVAIAHRKHPDGESVSTVEVDPTTTAVKKMSSSFVAGSYGIGDMTVFLGYSRDSMEDVGCTEGVAERIRKNCYTQSKTRTTYAGVHGGVGDTGVNYVFTMRSVKTNGTGNLFDQDAVDAVPSYLQSKSTPWTLGLSRSLGGSATVNFEHGEPDSDDDSSSAIWLQVDF